MTRAERRALAERKKRRVVLHNYWAMCGSRSFKLIVTPRIIGMAARTPHPCSSWCCGNERHHFGNPTMAERRASESEAEQLRELGAA